MPQDTPEKRILETLALAPSFHPSGAKLFVPDWTLDPGDVVTVQSDGENYDVPIYSLDLTWNGACRADIQSTGNQQREPLSALRRKEYQTGRRGYGLAKQVEEEVDEQYQHWTTENNVYKESVYKIMGVELNEDGTVKYIQATDEQGNPIYDEQGNPVWELDGAGNPKPVYNPDSDGSISGTVRTTAQDLESLYTVTGVASLPSGETTLYSYTSKIKQTADAVSSEVTAARGGEASLSSKITQLSGQIGLVVEKKNNKDVINRAAIVAAINKDDKATVTISADQIDLEGYVTADELYVDGQLSAGKTIYAGNLHVYEDAEIVGNISTSADSELTLGIVEATSLSATDTLYIGDTEITEDLLNSFLTSGIVSASVSNNILTLTDSSGNTVNFSKATSVSGEWGSNQQGQPTGVFTVTATQTNRNTTTGLDEPTTVGTVLTSITQAGHWGNTNNQEDPNTYYQSTNATIDTSQQLYAVKTAEINASGRYIAGQNSVVSTFTKAQSLPSGITPTDFSAGELWRYHVTKDGTDVADAYYRVLSGGGNRTVESLYPGTITLSEEETELSEHVLDAYYTSGTDTTPVTVKVDASAVFSAGVTQGMGGIAIDVVKDAWVTSTANMTLFCKFRPSAGDGNEQSVLIKQSPVRNQSSSTGTVNLTDYDEIIGSVTLDMTRSGDKVILRHLKNPTVTPSTIIAGTPIAVIDVPSSGPTIVSDVDKIVQIGNIEYSSDYKTATIAVQAQDSSSRELLTDDITTSVESAWEAGRTVGIREGSGLQVEEDHYELITDNNTTVSVFPTRPNNVMSSASIRVEVPVHEGIQGATLLASTDSDSAWDGWQLNDHTTLSKKYGFIRITGKDGSTYSYGVDANELYDAGVSAGVGVEIEDTKAYPSTITSSGDYEITPSSGKYAMKKATFSVSMPNIYGTYNAGQLPAGSGTISPPSGYYAMRAVTYSVASAAHSLDVYQNASVKTSAGLGVRSAGSVKYSDLSAGKYIRFGIECGDNVQSLFYVSIT